VAKHKRPHGQLRQSQVVTTFGPGATLDLPKCSVLVGGLEYWQGVEDEIIEPRLVEKLEDVLEAAAVKLYAPPPDQEDPAAPRTGIGVWQFPEWFVTQDVAGRERAGRVRSRYLVPRKALIKNKFEDMDGKKHPVVPIRFVRACRRGHIGDIHWHEFVHKGERGCRRQLRIEERGTSGDLAEVVIRCECGASRPMSEAAKPGTESLGLCDGARPWLGPYAHEPCGEPNRLLVRTASNAYFPQIMSVISLPDRDEALKDAVDQVWENWLQYVDSQEDLQSERTKKPPVREALDGFSDEQVFEELQSRKSGQSGALGKTVKQAELETLLAAKEEIGNDKPDGDFYARSLPLESLTPALPHCIERVVLVHRLREVVAQVGFTRFEATSPDVEGELEIGVRRAPLSRELDWLPAVENRGEGVFLAFKREAIQGWLKRPAVAARAKSLMKGFDAWLDEHSNSKRKFSGLPYLMLHSLSHLLITAVTLECGYPASSIRERIYATDSGCGILLYTGSPDAEGTLGGLVEIGRRISHHLTAALELGKLCSNDPVCAQHDPGSIQERRFLHGAACHACLLIAETCCEQHNDFLDRALVVPTVEGLQAEFFSEEDG